jgi:hypothetical protein
LKRGVGALPIAFLFAFLLAIPFQATMAAATSACSSTGCWFETGDPVYAPLGPYTSFGTTYANGINATVTGVVFMVVHNSLGQTVQISTCVLQLAAGANGTAYTIAFGLASGEYSATFFVVSTGGYAISSTTAAPFTV